ncbi:MAG: hypothetical protein C0410_04730 [Anaerolinea sp.]|nr:hypothetical protein [Anaerolinea sp.]
MMKKIPKSVCKVVEKQLQIKQIWMIGLVTEEKHFGAFVILCNEIPSQYTSVIESIVHQATQVIKRLESEKIKQLSEERLQTTFEAIEDGYWDWNIQTGKIITNDKWFTMLGYQPGEFPATYENLIKLVHPQDLKKIKYQIEEALQNRDQQYNIEFRLRMKSGEYKYMQSRGKIIAAVKGDKSLRMVGIYSDISERKKIEQQILDREAKYRTLYETMRQGAFYQDADGHIIDVNPAALKFFGLTREEFLGGNISSILSGFIDEYGHKIENASLPSYIALKTGKPVYEQTLGFYNSLRKQETWAVVSAIPQFRVNEKTPYQVFVTLQDITQLKQIEKELRNSELRYRTLIQNSPAGIYQADVTGNTIYSNDRLSKITGLDIDSMAKTGWINAVHPEDKAEVVRRWQAFIQSGGRWSFEYRQLNQETGKVSWVFDEAVELLDEEGNRIGFIGSVVDLTEQKVAEEKLIKSEEKYRLLTENMKDVIWILDTQTMRFTYMSPSVESLRGYTVNEVLSGTLVDALTEEGEKYFSELITEKVNQFNLGEVDSEDFFTYEIPQPRKDGSFIWTEVITSLHKNPETGHLDLHGVARDISDRKNIETSLRKSEEKYRLLTENMKDVIWTLDTETMNITYMSPSIINLRGFSVEEVKSQGIGERLLSMNTDNVLKLMKQQIAEFMKDPNGPVKYFSQEFLQSTKAGSTIWTEIVVNYYINQETGHIEMRGVSRDISERKKAELERQSLFEIMQGLSRSKDLDQFLQLIHQVLSRIIDAKNISIVFYNKDTGLFEEIYCVDEFDSPYPPSKLGKSITSYVFRTGKAVILGEKAFKDLARTGEVRLVGSESAVWMGAPIKDADDVIGVISVQNYKDENAYSERDKEFLSSIAAQVAIAIKRKRAEEAIQRSEEKHRLLIENSHDIIYTLNLEGKFTFVSNAWSVFLGYPVVAVLGQSFSKFLNVKDQKSFREFFSKTILNGEKQTGIEYKIKHADGSWRWHTTNAVPIKNSDGVCIGIEGTARDISERKQTEEALQESEERYRVLVENSPIGIMLAQKGKLIYANSAGVDLFGYKSMDEMLGQSLLKYIHPESQKVLLKRIIDLKRGQENALLEIKILKKNGEICETESISSVMIC